MSSTDPTEMLASQATPPKAEFVPSCPMPRPTMPKGELCDDELDGTITMALLALYHDLIRRYVIRILDLKVSPLANPLRGQGQVLALLKQQGSLTAKEMAGILGIRTASVNELLVKLEAKGLVKRSRSSADGRITVATITEEGRAVEQAPFASEMRAFLDEMQGFYQGLTLDEKRGLVKALQRVDEAANASGASDGASGPKHGDQHGQTVPGPEMWTMVRRLVEALELDKSFPS